MSDTKAVVLRHRGLERIVRIPSCANEAIWLVNESGRLMRHTFVRSTARINGMQVFECVAEDAETWPAPMPILDDEDEDEDECD